MMLLIRANRSLRMTPQITVRVPFALINDCSIFLRFVVASIESQGSCIGTMVSPPRTAEKFARIASGSTLALLLSQAAHKMDVSVLLVHLPLHGALQG